MRWKLVNDIEGTEWKSFTFRMATISDLDVVVDFLMRNYLRDELLHIALGQSCEDTIQYEKLIFAALLKQNLSFIAFDRATRKIAGVILTSHYDKDVDNGLPIVPPANNHVGKFFNDIEAETNIFEYYGVQTYGETYIVAVSHDFRGQGLAKEMFRRSISIFESIGDKIVMSFVSSPFVRKICTSLNFEELKSWQFSEAKDDNGSSLLKDWSLNGRVVLNVLKL